MPDDDIKNAVFSCLERYILPGQRVTIGISGGIDSVALLKVTADLHKRSLRPFLLSTVHVNHGLSPAADRWQSFVERYATSLGVPCSSFQVVVERGSCDGLEAAARRARYAVFDTIDTDWLMLAHHCNDQAETMLFNLLRGSGLAGAAAMRERRGRILRPWLLMSRKAIEKYAKKMGIQWCEDESNLDTLHTRNYLRHLVFPLLETRFPSGGQRLAKSARHFAEALTLLDDLALVDLGGIDHFPIDVSILSDIGEARGRNVLRYLLGLEGVHIPSETRLREALRQMLTAGTDKHPVVVIGQHRLIRRKNRIHLIEVADSTESL